jgi:hypothetical protein
VSSSTYFVVQEIASFIHLQKSVQLGWVQLSDIIKKMNPNNLDRQFNSPRSSRPNVEARQKINEFAKMPA